MPRMKFLTKAEGNQFDAPPSFSAAERKRFFNVTEGLHGLLQTLKTPTNQVCFVIALGYFRAAKRFFGQEFRDEDIRFVATRLGYFPEMVCVDGYEKSTAMRHRRMILDHLGYREFDAAARDELARQIRGLVRTQMRPNLILARLVEILEGNRTEVPSAWVLTELVNDEMQRHEQELSSVLDSKLTADQRNMLDALLEKESTDDEVDTKWHRFKVTLLKRFSHSTKPRKIGGNVEDLRTLRTLFLELEPVILRFVATIKLKETTASQLFKRLNSYSSQHPLYKALKEFGKITKPFSSFNTSMMSSSGRPSKSSSTRARARTSFRGQSRSATIKSSCTAKRLSRKSPRGADG